MYLRRMLENEMKKRNKQPIKKAHLATQDNGDIKSEDDEEKEEKALFCLMEVNNSNSNTLDNNVDDL